MLYRRRLKYFLFKFLRLHGTPHKVALGFALGSTINFIPTFGFAIPIAAFFAGIFRLNIVAAVIGDIIFKPLFPLLFYIDIRVGNLFLGNNVGQDSMHISMFTRLNTLTDLGWAFFIGIAFNVIVFTAVLYIVSFLLLKYFRLPLLRSLRYSRMLN